MMIILAKYTIYNAGAPKILVLSLSARRFADGIINDWDWGLINKVTVRFQFSNHIDWKSRETCKGKKKPSSYILDSLNGVAK